MACLIEFNILCPWSLRACQKMPKKKPTKGFLYWCITSSKQTGLVWSALFIRCKAPHETGSQLTIWLSHIEPVEASPQVGAVPHTPFGEVKKRQQRRSADWRRCYVLSRKLKGVNVFTVTCKVKQNDTIMEYHRVPLFSGSEVLWTKVRHASIQPFLSWYLFWYLNSGYQLILNPYELMGRSKVMFILGL